MLRSAYLNTDDGGNDRAKPIYLVLYVVVRVALYNAASKSDEHLATFPSGCGAQVR